MGAEQQGEVEHEGERYLALLGLSDFADQTVTRKDGSTFEARDFLDVCGGHARPMLVGFEAMSPSDPKYDIARNALRGMIGRYVTGSAD